MQSVAREDLHVLAVAAPKTNLARTGHVGVAVDPHDGLHGEDLVHRETVPAFRHASRHRRPVRQRARRFHDLARPGSLGPPPGMSSTPWRCARSLPQSPTASTWGAPHHPPGVRHLHLPDLVTPVPQEHHCRDMLRPLPAPHPRVRSTDAAFGLCRAQSDYSLMRSGHTGRAAQWSRRTNPSSSIGGQPRGDVRLLEARGLGDGLPVVPPTPERVDAMLARADGDPDEVLFTLQPRRHRHPPGAWRSTRCSPGAPPRPFRWCSPRCGRWPAPRSTCAA